MLTGGEAVMGNSVGAIANGPWWRYVPAWVLATASPAALFLLPRDRSPWANGMLAAQLVAFLILIAVAQWWVLHERTSRARAWAVMTLIGACLAILAQIGTELFFLATVERVADGRFLPMIRTWEPSAEPAELLRYGSSGGAFGLVLGATQSLVSPFAWRCRLVWIAASTVTSALSFAAAFLAFDFNLTYGSPLWVTATSIYVPVPPIAWISYALISGIVLYRLLITHTRGEAEGVLRRFE